MADLIDRQAAVDAVEKESQVDGAYGYMDTKSIVDLLMDLPSAQPFNKGLWVKQEIAPQTLRFYSLCGCKKPRGVVGNFCPNCGARMRGEDG